MSRTLIRQIVCDAEPMLGHVRDTARYGWLPDYARQVRAVDTKLWQTRAARGFSWYSKGMVR
ncbi:MAG: hypothetical protein ACREXP_26785 [Steroidobacteraceae bacterium]